MKQLLLSSTENLESLKHIQEENEHFTNKNGILTDSLHLVSSKLDKREGEVEKLLIKLDEIENELEESRGENQRVSFLYIIFVIIIDFLNNS
jgi:hypothetical protein